MSVRIFERNFIDDDILANRSVSSEQAAFKVENAFNQARRSKVWRSNGYWKIPASAAIRFRETSAGPDLIATIAEQEITSTATLLTTLKTALEAVGSSVYTPSIDTASGKIKITSDGAGGAGDFEIDWTDGTSTTMADILGFVSDDAGALAYTADVLKIAHPNEWILFDMGIETNPRNFLMTGPRNEPLKLSPGATFKLKGNETDPADWSSPSFEKTLTYNDEIFVELTDTGFHTEGLRYWRLEFNDTGDTGALINGNPNGYVEIGVFFLGDELFSDLTEAVNRGGVDFNFTSQYVDASTELVSEGGQRFSNQKPQTQQYSFQWKGLTKEQVEEVTDFFRTVGTSKPFFVAFDPKGPVNWTSINRSAAYVRFTDEPKWTLGFHNYYLLTMSVREEL